VSRQSPQILRLDFSIPKRSLFFGTRS